LGGGPAFLGDKSTKYNSQQLSPSEEDLSNVDKCERVGNGTMIEEKASPVGNFDDFSSVEYRDITMYVTECIPNTFMLPLVKFRISIQEM
jgi:hypothetical protein